MFLSNPYKFFLLAVVCSMSLQGCGSTPTNESTLITVIPESKSGFPFTTKEPEVYQGNQIINGNEAGRTFIAKKGPYFRYDHFRDGSPAFSELRTDNLYLINHTRKIYAEELLNTGIRIDPVGFDHFQGKEHWVFDVVGIEGGIAKYKVRQTEHMTSEILIHIDEKSGVIVRQEFLGKAPGDGGSQPGFVYEIRDLKLDVDDAAFALPQGYRKVPVKELRSMIKK